MGSGFKVSVFVEIFSVIYSCEISVAGPVLSALQLSVMGSTSTPVEGGIPVCCAWGDGVGVRRGRLSILLSEPLV